MLEVEPELQLVWHPGFAEVLPLPSLGEVPFFYEFELAVGRFCELLATEAPELEAGVGEGAAGAGTETELAD